MSVFPYPIPGFRHWYQVYLSLRDEFLCVASVYHGLYDLLRSKVNALVLSRIALLKIVIPFQKGMYSPIAIRSIGSTSSSVANFYRARLSCFISYLFTITVKPVLCAHQDGQPEAFVGIEPSHSEAKFSQLEPELKGKALSYY